MRVAASGQASDQRTGSLSPPSSTDPGKGAALFKFENGKTGQDLAKAPALIIRNAQITPEDYLPAGDTTRSGKATSAAALGDGYDWSTVMQAAMAAAASERRVLEGNGKWYAWGSATCPSGLKARNLRAVVPDDDADNAPFFLDGQANEVVGVELTDCEVDGNRVGQTSLSSSNGDGQRAGFKLFGHTRDCKLVRPKAWNCATDGLFVWTGSVVPANADDLLHHNLLVSDGDFQWNGRHGASFSSHKGTRIVGGRYKNNGKDASGWTPSGTYSDGGYARREGGTLSGNKYGRGVTHEGYFLGGHFEDFWIAGADITENWFGTLMFAVMFSTVRSHKTLQIVNTAMDDPNGGNGDGSLNLFAVLDDGAGNRTTYTDTDAFDGVYLDNNTYGRNYVRLRCLRNWRISGKAAMDPLVSVWSMDVDHHEAADCIDLAGNGYVNGYTLPFALSVSASWTVGAETVTLLFPIRSGRHRVRLDLPITIGAGTGYIDISAPAGWVIEDTALARAVNTTDSTPIHAVAYDSVAGPNVVNVYVEGDGSGDAGALSLYVTVRRAGS